MYCMGSYLSVKRSKSKYATSTAEALENSRKTWVEFEGSEFEGSFKIYVEKSTETYATESETNPIRRGQFFDR